MARKTVKFVSVFCEFSQKLYGCPGNELLESSYEFVINFLVNLKDFRRL